MTIHNTHPKTEKQFLHDAIGSLDHYLLFWNNLADDQFKTLKEIRDYLQRRYTNQCKGRGRPNVSRLDPYLNEIRQCLKDGVKQVVIAKRLKCSRTCVARFIQARGLRNEHS